MFVDFSQCWRGFAGTLPLITSFPTKREGEISGTSRDNIREAVMNLFDCHVPYTQVSSRLLNRGVTKTTILAAVRVYRSKNTHMLTDETNRLSKWEREIVRESIQDLQRLGIITDSMEYVEPPLDERVCIPSDLKYADFTLAEIKLLIACYDMARGLWTPFTFMSDLNTLAEHAGISHKSVRTAIEKLEERQLIRTAKVWHKGTRFTLLDPSDLLKGWDLVGVGQFYRDHMDDIPVHERYRVRLGNALYDPKGRIGREAEDGVKVFCPFCKPKGKRKPNFTFSSLSEDRWACANCRRSGDSVRLWARLAPYRDNWMTLMEKTGIDMTTRGAPLPHEADDHMIGEEYE
jgi:hypothetical protein